MTDAQMSEVNGLACDLLVIGGGIAGMSAAGYAAEAGAIVGVVEKGHEIGGSAVLSNGTVWTPASRDVADTANPKGDSELVDVLVGDFEAALAWVRSTGVTMTERQNLTSAVGLLSYGYTIDVLGLVNSMRRRVESTGGWVVTDAAVNSLICSDSRVTGASVSDRDGSTEVACPWTLLATGGFQNSPELRDQYIGQGAGHLLVRSNPQSDGHGLRLGLAAGGSVSAHMDSFYGMLMAAPINRRLADRDFQRLGQLYSPRGLLLDRSGQRFVDESISYHNNARAVRRQPGMRAILVADESIRALDRTGYGVLEQMDRPTEAAREGANVAESSTWTELGSIVESWGYSGVARGVQKFNQDMLEESSNVVPPRQANRQALLTPPFFAVEVQPAITFTMGGLRINRNAEVLRPTGEPVGGLLAAGADAGGLYHDGYLGGLSMGIVFGIRAAKRALQVA